jgi:hypothetical protein
MPRIFDYVAICLVAGAVTACSRDEVIATENIPTAGVRFINAVPDTGAAFGLDFRWVDIIESNHHFRITFRNSPTTSGGVTASTTAEYKPARAGSRQFRIFLDDTSQAVASTVLKDSTVSIEAGQLYTALLMGNARASGADRMRLLFLNENVADPGANVALRVINTTSSPIDVRQYAASGTAPAAATWANVPPYSVSTYVTVPPGQIRFNVRPAGGSTALFSDALALPGAPPTSSAGPGGKIDIEAAPGTTVAGSAVSLIVFPRSVAGSKAPQTSAFQVPAASFVWDRRPPRPPGI